jgi:hypothetical protein
MPVSCYSTTGRVRFDAARPAAIPASPAAAEFCSADEIIDAALPPTIARRCRRYVPDALVLAGLFGLLLAGALLL